MSIPISGLVAFILFIIERYSTRQLFSVEHHFQKQKSLLICRLLYENTWVLFAVLVRRKLWLIQQADADIVSYRHSKVAGALLRFGSITWQVYLKNPQQLQCFAWKNTWTTSPWKLDDIQIYTWIKTGDFSVCVPLCQRYPNLLRFDDLTVCTPPFAVKVRHFHVSRTSIEKSGSIRYVASTIMQLILAFLCWAVRFESVACGNRWYPVAMATDEISLKSVQYQVDTTTRTVTSRSMFGSSIVDDDHYTCNIPSKSYIWKHKFDKYSIDYLVYNVSLCICIYINMHAIPIVSICIVLLQIDKHPWQKHCRLSCSWDIRTCLVSVD